MFNYEGTYVITSSFDRTCKLWDLRRPDTSVHTKIATASSDHIAKIYDVKTLTTEHTLVGHTHEISKVVFDSRGNTVITGSSDKACRMGY